MVEFSLVAMIFFLLSFAVIDFSWLLFNQMNMQNAVREAARYASTGNQVNDPVTAAPLSRANSITQILHQAAVGTKIQDVLISNNSGSGVACDSSAPSPLSPSSPSCAGGPGDTVTIQAVCDIPLLTPVLGKLFPGNQLNFTVRASFKNEPFPAALTYQ